MINVNQKDLIPLKDLNDLKDNSIIYGIGWDNEFQKGILIKNNQYIKFENPYGGTKVISKGWVGLIKQYKTVYGGLFYSI